MGSAIIIASVTERLRIAHEQHLILTPAEVLTWFDEATDVALAAITTPADAADPMPLVVRAA